MKEYPESLRDDARAHLLPPAELSKERMDKLEELGFEWDVAKPNLPWQTRFEQMLAFKEKNGAVTKRTLRWESGFTSNGRHTQRV